MDLEHKAIERIKLASEMSLHYYKKPLVCTYSGGKDSDVMLELFKRSGVLFEVSNSHTTADAPPTVHHIREIFRKLELEGIKCSIDYHVQPDGSRTTMWNLIPKKMFPPTRAARYCCDELKERGSKGRMIATGIRWAESRQRREREVFEALAKAKKNKVKVSDGKMILTDNSSTRKLFEQCQMKSETVVNPIIDWPDRDIWDFYWHECKNHNPLYQMGYYRVGCVGCPMAGKSRHKEFADFPSYKRAYIRAFDKMLEGIHAEGKETTWKNGHDVFLWWMEDRGVPGQMNLF